MVIEEVAAGDDAFVEKVLFFGPFEGMDDRDWMQPRAIDAITEIIVVGIIPADQFHAGAFAVVDGILGESGIGHYNADMIFILIVRKILHIGNDIPEP